MFYRCHCLSFIKIKYYLSKFYRTGNYNDIHEKYSKTNETKMMYVQIFAKNMLFAYFVYIENIVVEGEGIDGV